MLKNEYVVYHGDLTLHNVIESNQNLFLIDWNNAIIGDPAFDLAIYYTRVKWNFFLRKNIIKEYAPAINFIRKNHDLYINAFINEHVRISNISLHNFDL